MADVKHTALRLAPAPIHGHYDLLDERGEVIALSVPPEHAARMVLCWNTHDELVAALRRADQFITNGIALGFVRMPDPDLPDPAHETPGIVRAALSKATGGAS